MSFVEATLYKDRYSYPPRVSGFSVHVNQYTHGLNFLDSEKAIFGDTDLVSTQDPKNLRGDLPKDSVVRYSELCSRKITIENDEDSPCVIVASTIIPPGIFMYSSEKALKPGQSLAPFCAYNNFEGAIVNIYKVTERNPVETIRLTLSYLPKYRTPKDLEFSTSTFKQAEGTILSHPRSKA